MAYRFARLDGVAFRFGSWRGDPAIGYLAPVVTSDKISDEAIAAATDMLRTRGYARVITSAIAADETDAFRRRGFDVIRELVLLRHDLRTLPRRGSVHTRRVRSRERDLLLDIDRCAFDDFWTLDTEALDEAYTATTRRRVRFAVDPEPIGYAITGTAAGVGYLQRLAVIPGEQGRGVALALVSDAMRWARRVGAGHAVVNTQPDNDRAIALYEGAGFVRQQTGLVVLARDLATVP